MSLRFLGCGLLKALKKLADPLRESPPRRHGKLGPWTGNSRQRQAVAGAEIIAPARIFEP